MQFTDANGTKTIWARWEVVIVCGAIKSSQLLELSGIGDRQLTSVHGIDCAIDNPHVGENLQNHVLTSISFEVADDQVSGGITRNASLIGAAVRQYLETRGGPLSGTAPSFVYTPLVDRAGTMAHADVEALVRKCFYVGESTIEVRYVDVEMPTRAVRFAETVARTEPLSGLLEPGGRESEPGLGLGEAIRVVRKRLFTVFDWSGTCAVLPRAQRGVHLRVYGTINVRVVDANIFPIEPLGHFQSTVYGMPEKAADLTKADW